MITSRLQLPMMRYSYMVRIFYFLLITFVGLMAAVVAMALIVGDGYNTLALRLATVSQDILLFVFPAVAASVILSDNGARMLCIDRMPSLPVSIVAIAALVCSVPAMNMIVMWNESMSLPPVLAPLETWMRQAEDAAQQQVAILLGGTSYGDLAVSMLIVAVLAGVSEELFFRGAMQRILSSGPLGPHAAIWLTALLFSVFHMQFYGFVPRVLLGAFFGYLLYWSQSVWLPAMVHAMNNGSVVYSSWLSRAADGVDHMDVNTLGTGSWVMISVSLILTVAVLCVLKNITKTRNRVMS